MAIRKGTKAADILLGTSLADVIYGYGGNDRLYGYDGNDTLYGYDGNDWLNAQAGDDRLFGHAGNDWMSGGAGNDALDGGAGDDIMYGGTGDDDMLGRDGNDRMYGGEGWNVLVGDDGNDSLYGGSIDDNLQGGDGNDLIYGYGGDDCLHGLGNGHDRYFAGEGNDTIECGTGTTLADCGGGDDLVFAALGVNDVRGGAGRDTVSYLNVEKWGFFVPVTAGAFVNLVIGVGGGSAAGDRYVSIENVIGSVHADRIYLNNGGEATGGGGNDYIAAFGAGTAIMRGGSGSDVLRGNAGSADHFVVEKALGADRFQEFERGLDKLVIDNAIFAIGTTLEANELVAGTMASGSFAQFLFDGSGRLSYDPDGEGGEAATLVAVITAPGGASLRTLETSDFLII